MGEQVANLVPFWNYIDNLYSYSFQIAIKGYKQDERIAESNL